MNITARLYQSNCLQNTILDIMVMKWIQGLNILLVVKYKIVSIITNPQFKKLIFHKPVLDTEEQCQGS